MTTAIMHAIEMLSAWSFERRSLILRQLTLIHSLRPSVQRCQSRQCHRGHTGARIYDAVVNTSPGLKWTYARLAI